MRQLGSGNDADGLIVDARAFGLIKAAYSVKETLELLSLGRTTFYGLVDRGDLNITKLGKINQMPHFLRRIPCFWGERKRIADVMATNKIPTIYPFHEYAEIGGFIMCGAELFILFQRAAG